MNSINYLVARSELENEIVELHNQRKEAFRCQNFRRAHTLGAQIDSQVMIWNLEYPKEPNYLDLHWMTREGAIKFVLMMTEGTKGVWFLETGRGNHSKDGKAVIRTALLEMYGEAIWARKRNPGILVLQME